MEVLIAVLKSHKFVEHIAEQSLLHVCSKRYVMKIYRFFPIVRNHKFSIRSQQLMRVKGDALELGNVTAEERALSNGSKNYKRISIIYSLSKHV
jgi:phage antirepressor YoqD-like protein